MRYRRNPWLSSRRAVLTREQRLLLEACLRTDGRAIEAWRRWCSSADFEDLDGPSQGLVPLLYRNLQALGVRDPILRRYKGAWRFHWSRNQKQLARVAHLARAFAERSLPIIALKDLALLLAHDEDVGIRSMSDIGFLVRPEHAPQALEVLAGAGYRPLRRRRYRFVLKAEDGSPSIALHWHVFPGHDDRQADAPFWSRAQTAPHGRVSADVAVLDRSDLLLHGLVHGTVIERLPPLRWLPDAAVVVRRGDVAWERLADDAERLGLGRKVAAALRELRGFVAFELPAGVLDRLERQSASRVGATRVLARAWWPKTIGALSMRGLRRLVHGSPHESTAERP